LDNIFWPAWANMEKHFATWKAGRLTQRLIFELIYPTRSLQGWKVFQNAKGGMCRINKMVILSTLFILHITPRGVLVKEYI
jgi:hypothetical protein